MVVLNMDRNELIEYIKEKLADADFAKSFVQKFAAFERSRQQAQRTDDERVRELAARRGYRIMHRGKGLYWLMIDKPMSLDVIQTWIDQQNK